MSPATHANSLSAFASLDLNAREALVLSAYLLAAAPMSDRDCAKRMGANDMNQIRPRVTALVGKALLWEVGSIKCEVSGRRVRLCIPTAKARKAKG